MLKHRPVYWLHSQEVAFPLSQPEYFNHCEAVDENGQVYTTDKLTPQRVHDLIHDIGRPPKGSTLRIKAAFDPIKLGRRDFDNVPIHANYYKYEGKWYINYITCFGYNEAFRILRLARLGEHYADIEHQTLELEENEDTGEITPVRLYYAAHGNANGRWILWDDVEKTGDDPARPVVYLAHGSHAAYHQPGRWFRLFGAANDRTEQGYIWRPQVDIVYPHGHEKYDPNTMGWLRWTRDVGNGEVGALATKNWWLKNIGNEESDPALFMTETKGYRFEVFQGTLVLLLIWSILLIFLWVFLAYSMRSLK